MAMTANETLALIISTISTMMTQVGYPISVQSAYQPTQQGTQFSPFIAINYVSGRRYGYPQVTEKVVVDNTNGSMSMERIETYWLEEVYQITAYAIASPNDIASPTAYTYATRAAAVLQSQQARGILLASGVGFQRITTVRTPYFQDDLGRQEMAPSFDFTITRQERLMYKVPLVTDFSIGIHRV